MLTFDSTTHTYRWNDAVVPNVTRILGSLVDYSRIPPDVLLHAQQEGKAIHEMVELDVADNLDVDLLPEWMLPRYQAWRSFLAETGFKPLASEQRVFSRSMRYAGTLDLFGRFPGCKHAVVDVKRSLYAGRVIGLQMAAYKRALAEDGVQEARGASRFGLLLDANGRYRMEPFNNPNDESDFMACLVYYRLKESLK